MKSNSRIRICFSAAVALLLGAATYTAHAQPQSFYSVSKSQGFFQNSSAAPVADPTQPFNFSAQAAVNTTLTAPAGGAIPLTLTSSSDGNDYEKDQTFATKTDLDAAFPNGTYKMTGGGIATLSFNMAVDNYPTVTPQITNGTWNNGVLVVNPAQATTINFNTFSTYATAGVAGHMETHLNDFSSNGGEGIKGEAATVAVAGITPSSTPLTSISIPAGTLTNGHIYEGRIQWDTITTLDTTTISGGTAVGIFTKGVRFYISAQAAGSNFPAPIIVGQPTDQTAPIGGRATFNLGVTIGGGAPNQNSGLNILWSFNGQQLNIDNVKYTFNGGALVVNNVTAADVGSYSATLIAPGGVVTSNSAALTIGAAPTPVAPVIVLQPVAKNVGLGSTVVFSVVATGSAPLSYQWKKDGVNVAIGNGINNGLSSSLVIQGATAISAGNYSVVVSNSANSAGVTSNAAALTITSTNDPGRLTNLSVLTDVTAGTADFTVATVVGGGGTGAKPLVVRAVGPSLGALGVPGTISDPQLVLFNASSVQIAANDNWNGDPALLAAMTSVGGFAFTGPTSKDAAVYQSSLAPGNYSVKVSGVNGSTGSVIAEIYDASPLGPTTASSSRLIDVSVLKPISSGGTLTLGFTLSGAVAKTVLIRAIGPGLAAVGFPVGSTLGDPQLTLFNSSSTQIASNDDWGADPQIIGAAGRVGAFAIGSTQSKDAMLLITLPAGAYTAQVKGGGGTSGTAIVEVYEVP